MKKRVRERGIGRKRVKGMIGEETRKRRETEKEKLEVKEEGEGKGMGRLLFLY